MKLNFTISFTENQWICYNDSIEVKADSLEEIDDNLEKYLKSTYQNSIIEVTMFFDFDRFPHWHRQYMPHYFNRNLTFNLTS